MSSPRELPALVMRSVRHRAHPARHAFCLRRRRREILASLEPLGIHVQSLPDLSDIIAGKASIDELHDVDVE